jgi:hypothetical protein
MKVRNLNYLNKTKLVSKNSELMMISQLKIHLNKVIDLIISVNNFWFVPVKDENTSMTLKPSNILKTLIKSTKMMFLLNI